MRAQKSRYRDHGWARAAFLAMLSEAANNGRGRIEVIRSGERWYRRG